MKSVDMVNQHFAELQRVLQKGFRAQLDKILSAAGKATGPKVTAWPEGTECK